MLYKLHQITQMGELTDEMLERLAQKSKTQTSKEEVHKKKCNKQIDRKKITAGKQKKLDQEESLDLKQLDHLLAFNILNEEMKALEVQLAEYKAILHAEENNENNISQEEVVSNYKVYEHLLIQKQAVIDKMKKYDSDLSEHYLRDIEKERMIKTLVKNIGVVAK